MGLAPWIRNIWTADARKCKKEKKMHPLPFPVRLACIVPSEILCLELATAQLYMYLCRWSVQLSTETLTPLTNPRYRFGGASPASPPTSTVTQTGLSCQYPCSSSLVCLQSWAALPTCLMRRANDPIVSYMMEGKNHASHQHSALLYSVLVW
jgi:hypothetical protein